MRLAGYQFLSYLGIGSLFAMTGLRQFFVEPLANPMPNTIWFVLQVTPLLLVLPGILRGRPRSFMLCALVAMLYFCHGVLLAVGEAHRALGLWEVGISIALIAITSLAVRHLWRPGAASDLQDR